MKLTLRLTGSSKISPLPPTSFSRKPMSKIVGLIPARWSSTRFPGKPLHLISGKPLLQHVWEQCRKARGIDRIVVATDDTRIATAARRFGAEVAMTSKKHRSGTDRVAEAAAKLRGL